MRQTAPASLNGVKNHLVRTTHFVRCGVVTARVLKLGELNWIISENLKLFADPEDEQKHDFDWKSSFSDQMLSLYLRVVQKVFFWLGFGFGFGFFEWYKH